MMNKKPKIVYVDQNKLIDLARQRIVADENGVSNSYTILYNQVCLGNILIPLSLTHLIETAKHSDEFRREKFAEFIGLITKGYCFAPFFIIKKYEVFQAVKCWSGKTNAIYLGGKSNSFINSGVIGQGLLFLVGRHIDEDKISEEHLWVKDFFTSEQSFFDAMINFHDEDFLKGIKELETEMIESLEFSRDYNRNATDEEIFKNDLSDYALNNVVPLINEACTKFQITPKDLYDDLDTWEKVKDFMMSIPSVDITLRLLHDLCKQKDRPLSRNDLRDVAFLTSAIPYCDIIVTEKFWAHTVQKLKIDEQYGTEIFTNIDDAVNSLLK